MTFPISSASRACTPAGCTPAANGERSIDRFFEDFFGGMPPSAIGRADFAPALDITENEGAILIRAEVPGVDPKDITVTFERNVLTVSGEKKAEEKTENDRFHRIERRYGRFVRQVEFNTPVDSDKIDAAFKNGVLTVTLPKHEKARVRTIEVKPHE